MLVYTFLGAILLFPSMINGYVIVYPSANITWTIGQEVTLRWQGHRNVKLGEPQFLTVDLMAVPSQGEPTKVVRMCDRLDISMRSCSWKVPDWVPTFKYSTRINYNNANNDADYGEVFTITGRYGASDGQLPREPSPESCLGPGCNSGTNPPSNFDPSQLNSVNPASSCPQSWWMYVPVVVSHLIL